MRYFHLFLLTLISQFAIGQIETPVTWDLSQERISENEMNLVFDATIEDGWYVYSQKIGDNGPIPTTFEFDSNDAVEFIGETEEIE